jgi:hypothetical protein
MKRYTDAWGRGSKDIMWNLPCEPGVTFECTQNVVDDIIVCLPFMFKKYKKIHGIEMTLEIDEAYYDSETHEKWYRVNYKVKEQIQ